MELAFRKVKRNHGAPGIDGETVLDFNEALETNIEFLHENEKLKTNTYEPDPVRRVEIEKPDGGIRLLGVPTVKDRVVQQAIVNIIEPIYEPTFHPSSYGYRPNHSPQQAVAKAERFMNRYGLTEVVDMDLSKCFDTLDHEILMRAVAERISDGKVLGLLRKFLKSGVMQSDRFIETEVGSCQGGVISPLLSNIYLNQFDQKMKGKGLRIVRYADDILIFAKDKQTAGNYKAYATKVLEQELKLKVNETKTRLTSVREGVTFLGFVIYAKYLVINPKRIKRFKDKIRNITRRNAGRPLEKVIKELNPVLRGWLNYYRIANIKSLITEMMSWIRRRLRMIKMKQWKTYKAMHKAMRKQGIKGSGEKMAVTKWKNSNVHVIHMLLSNQYFEDLGLIDLGQYKVGLLSNYY
ncbi:group II intron reverse transcriptase/maturase [Acetobacterium malicum]|uniref:group II intron reverse transcriptase/maturase n=1 Tax=Acetobacterium malicum TaxID=52692 RepID=UPI001FAB5EDD|nr:group II intron reverse transcriptase/maturase [Acetobacterium malicum]